MKYVTYFPHFSDYCDAFRAYNENPSPKAEAWLKTCYAKCVNSVLPVVGEVAKRFADENDDRYWPIHKGYTAMSDEDYEFSSVEDARKAWEEDINYTMSDWVIGW